MCKLYGFCKVALTSVVNFSTKPHMQPMALHIPITNGDATRLAIDYLKSGLVIAVPTDTVYGLACDATNSSAIDSLYSIKCRNESKPIAICLGQPYEVKLWADITHLPPGLLGTLLPGPVTLILNCINKLDSSLAFNGKVGIRIPNYEFIRDLAIGLGRPLALTSANTSNDPSATDILEFKGIWDKLPVIFDGGTVGTNHNASTIVDLTVPGTFKVNREGIAYNDTVKILSKFGLNRLYE